MLRIPPHPELHPVFEALAYALGYWAYKRARASSGDVLAESQRWSVIAAAALGALAGSRLLGLLEQAPRVGFHAMQLVTPGGGKTIVGGLLGGWIGVEIARRAGGIRTRTGDLFAIPLALGIAIGRVGCLLAGLADDTYGKPTTLPWAVDFGDGIGRHPTQAYEIVFLLALIAVLHWLGKRQLRAGTLFRVFLAAYLAWRFAIDFIKPQPLVDGLNLIQWACLGGLLALLVERFAIGPRTDLQEGAVKLADHASTF